MWSGGSIAIQIHRHFVKIVTFCVQCSEGPVQCCTMLPTGRGDRVGCLATISDHCIECTVTFCHQITLASRGRSSRWLTRAQAWTKVRCPGDSGSIFKISWVE